MCYDNEELCKIWKGLNLSVQNSHKEFNKFWPEYSKISKICTLMGCFWPKYTMLELRKYRGVMFDYTQDWYRVWRKVTCASKNDMRNLTWGIRALSLKIGTLMSPFRLKLKMYELKTYREVMCHDNEEWYKIWKGIDLLVQNWPEEFDGFCRRDLKLAL